MNETRQPPASTSALFEAPERKNKRSGEKEINENEIKIWR